MTNDDPNAPTGSTPATRRSPRQGIGGSPVGSTVSIVLAVVAVIVGFLILNNITDNGSSTGGVTQPDSTTLDTTGDSVAVTAAPTTTIPPLVTEGATVVVANASGVKGSAGRMTTELAGQGFTTAEATNSTQTGLAESLVYYDPTIAAAQSVADSVGRLMGDLAVAPVGSPIPVTGGSLNGAGVLVVLGTAQADKTIAQLSAPVAGVTPTPEVAGSSTTSTTIAG